MVIKINDQAINRVHQRIQTLWVFPIKEMQEEVVRLTLPVT